MWNRSVFGLSPWCGAARPPLKTSHGEWWVPSPISPEGVIGFSSDLRRSVIRSGTRSNPGSGQGVPHDLMLESLEPRSSHLLHFCTGLLYQSGELILVQRFHRRIRESPADSLLEFPSKMTPVRYLEVKDVSRQSAC